MVDARKDTLNSELSSRLDQIFSDGDDPGLSSLSPGAPADRKPPGGGQAAGKPAEPPADSSIERLKAFILSLEWEITDPVLSDTVAEIDSLLGRFAGDKMLASLLQIQKAAVKYIQANKAKAHPDAINLIQSAFVQSERLLTTPGLTASDKKKVVSEELAKLKSLKQKIQASRKPAAATPPLQPPAQSEALISEIRSLKALFQAEMAALRKDLKAWLTQSD